VGFGHAERSGQGELATARPRHTKRMPKIILPAAIPARREGEDPEPEQGGPEAVDPSPAGGNHRCSVARATSSRESC
jgi:hypothetical protein